MWNFKVFSYLLRALWDEIREIQFTHTRVYTQNTVCSVNAEFVKDQMQQSKIQDRNVAFLGIILNLLLVDLYSDTSANEWPC